MSHSFAGSMPSKNLIAKPCPYNNFFSLLQESTSAPTKAARIKCLPGLRSAAAISEISSSVMIVSSRTNVIYPVEDGRRNIAESLRSFSMASSVYWYIPSKCSIHISPPANGRINDFFLYAGQFIRTFINISWLISWIIFFRKHSLSPALHTDIAFGYWPTAWLQSFCGSSL